MPYEWLNTNSTAPDHSGAASHPKDTANGPAATAADPALAELHLWPYRSLPKQGFVIFIGVTAGMISIPLLAILGTMALWAILPFVGAALGGVWFALQRSYRDGRVHEELQFWPDLIKLTRHDPNRPDRHWEANPHWVQVSMRASEGPVPHYLTLKGGGREVEIGAFLSEDERRRLQGELITRLHAIR